MEKKSVIFSIIFFTLFFFAEMSFLSSATEGRNNSFSDVLIYKDSCASQIADYLWKCHENNEQFLDYRIKKLRNFFNKYSSPLTKYAYFFVGEADRYNIDWRLLPAISGVESTFGHAIPYQSFNAYGWDNGNYYFDSWEDSISIVTRALALHYVAKGAKTVDQIAPIYNPVTPDSWAYKVKYFIKAIDKMPPQLLGTLNFSIDI